MGSNNTFIHTRKGKLHFFCPLCQYHQSTNTIEKMTWKHHAQIAVLTACVTLLGWPIFGWNALVFYLVFWMCFDFFYRTRKREALVCESCGFDPFLYKRDVRKARAALKKHWQTRIETENLFAGIKLKNYQTKSVEQTAPNVVPANNEASRGNEPRLS